MNYSLQVRQLATCLIFLAISACVKAQSNTENDFSHSNITYKPISSVLKDSTSGFRISGLYAGGRLGYYVSNIGDINMDGFDDISACAPYCTPENTTETGEVYVIFGSDSGFNEDLNIAELDGTNGFRVRGMNAEDRLGYGGANAAGDINNDGFPDIIITTPYSDPDVDSLNTGGAFVIFGRADGFAPIIELDTLSRYSGLSLYGTNYWDNFGTTGGYAGDMNGDSIDDFYVTADDTDFHGLSSGTVYVIYGKNHFPDTLDIDTLYQQHGFLINGKNVDDNVGIAAGSLKDINGDGISDLAVGAFHANGDTGAGYVVFGKHGTFEDTINTRDLDGTNGFELLGEISGDYAGTAVGDAGDLNGDGMNDLYISAQRREVGDMPYAGKTYIIYGSDSLFPPVISLGDISESQGFGIGGTQLMEFSGNSVMGVGDVNGDTIDDLLIGALFSSSNGLFRNGAAFVLYGKPYNFPSEFSLSSLTEADGYVIQGEDSYARLGFEVGGGGDFNGDGVNDFIIGADYGSENTPNKPGEAYLIYGIDQNYLDPDNDSIPNIADECPNEYGESNCNGCPCLQLNIKVMLEGPFDDLTGEMSTALNTERKVLPGQTNTSAFVPSTPAGQPYYIAPWNYEGLEGEDFTDADYSPDVVDWILVSVRRGIEKNEEVGKAAVLLHKDGTFQAKIDYATQSQVNDSLYIIIEHRNHMGVMSPHHLPINNGSINYDFTTQNSYNPPGGVGQTEIIPGKWAMYAGDADQLPDVESYDINGYDKAQWIENNGRFDIYSPADMDMDGDISAPDNAFWIRNNGRSSRVLKN